MQPQTPVHAYYSADRPRFSSGGRSPNLLSLVTNGAYSLSPVPIGHEYDWSINSTAPPQCPF
eukprot:1042988-Prorocentrum_minimum.AAC.1